MVGLLDRLVEPMMDEQRVLLDLVLVSLVVLGILQLVVEGQRGI